MLTSIAIVFLLGLFMAAVFKKIRLPRIIGMLLTGVVCGPYVLDLLDPSLLGISSDLRQMALIIILIKAGLALDIRDLKKVGRPALLMSFLPAVCEIIGCVLLAPHFLGVTVIEAAIIGAVLGAVSPAVVVPKMVSLMEEGYGTGKSIPQMLLAATSLDDVFVIVLFSSFVGMGQGSGVSVMEFVNIPVSIILGILVGAAAGALLAAFFEMRHQSGNTIRNSAKVMIILGISFLLMTLEDVLEPWVAVSGLLAVMSMATVLQMRSNKKVAKRLSEKFGKLWIAAEVVLFVMVGAAVDIRYTADAGLSVVALVFLALIFRSAGVCLCMLGTELNRKERLFCVIAYLPKATVQAAIGSVPLTLGLPCGKIVLTVAVLSIILTAPLGALGMEATYKKLLVHDKKN